MHLSQYLQDNNFNNKDIYIVNHSKSKIALFFKYLFSTDSKGLAKDKYIMIIVEKKKVIICKIDKDFNLLYTGDLLSKRSIIKVEDIYISTSKNPFARLNNDFI